MLKFYIEKSNGNTYLKMNMGLSYYYGIIDINIFPEEIKNNAEMIVNEAFEYYCKPSEKSPKIISKLELPDDSEKNNFLISFYLSNDFVKIHKIIKIEVTRHQKTIEDFLKDQAYQIMELETKVSSIKTFKNKLSNDNDLLRVDYNKLIEENKIIKEEVSFLKVSLANVVLKFDEILKQPTQKNTNIRGGAATYPDPMSSNIFNLPPATNGFTQPPTNNFNLPPPTNGFTAPPVKNGFTMPPATNGFTAPPTNNGFTAPPTNNGFTAPSNNIFNMPLMTFASGPKLNENKNGAQSSSAMSLGTNSAMSVATNSAMSVATSINVDDLKNKTT